MDNNRNILLIEDNNIAQYAAAEQIRQCGFTVDIAATREEALALLQKANGDYLLVFMDLELPDANGLELARELRQQRLLAKNIPIVALTAHTDDGYYKQAIKYGLDGLIHKPLIQADLEALFRQFKISEKQPS